VGEAKVYLGRKLLEKKPDQGVTLLKEVRGKHLGRALYLAGFHLYQNTRYQEAQSLFQRILKLDRRDSFYSEALFLNGECDYRQNKYREAARKLSKFLSQVKSSERFQVARLHLGHCELLCGKMENAVSLLERYLQKANKAAKSDQARANLWLGQARFNRGEHDRAEAVFKRVTTLSTGSLAAQAQFQIGRCRLAEGDMEGAVEAYLKLTILYDNEEIVSKGLLQIGRCYEDLKQRTKAVKFYKELMTRYPKTQASREASARLKNLQGV